MPDEIMLNQLGRTYFHEDYDLDAENPLALVALFVEDEPREYIEIFVE